MAYAVSRVSKYHAQPYTAEDILQRIDALAAEAANSRMPSILLAEIATLRMVLNFMDKHAA